MAQGLLRRSEEVNTDKIKSMIENAETNISSARIIEVNISKHAKEWMNVYTLHYESLRIYSECILYFDNFESTNHQCIFAAICTKHTALELDWNFFEKIRTKRHGVNYYGSRITYEDWKAIEAQIRVYLSTLRKSVLKSLKNNS